MCETENSIIDRLFAESDQFKKRNVFTVAYLGIKNLTDPKEMGQFLEEYVSLLRSVATEEGNEETRINPFPIAAHNIGYICGYPDFDHATAQRWIEFMEIGHPLLGGNPFPKPNST